MTGFVSDGKRMRVFTARGETIISRRIEREELGNFVFICLSTAVIFGVVVWQLWGHGAFATGKSILWVVSATSGLLLFPGMFITISGNASFLRDMVFLFCLSYFSNSLYESGWLAVGRDPWCWLAIIALAGVGVARVYDCVTRAIWEPLMGVCTLIGLVLVASMFRQLPSLPMLIVCAVLGFGGLLGALLLVGENSEYERGLSHLGGD